jgi:uncharacterized protein YabN with tetrapyrrole methylase and pyrophosphatase domain
MQRRKGSLRIVGTGIKFGLQTTEEARRWIERSDKVLYLFSDSAPGDWIKGINSSAESLERFYAIGKPREDTYREIAEEILTWVRKGIDVCVVFYGHPAVFVTPSHEAIRQAREEGFEAEMLPAVSAEDCLFADLGVDPGDEGCQSFEATSFLLFRRMIDPNVPLILWQVTGVGETDGAADPNIAGMVILAKRLEEMFGPDHEVVLYEASPYSVCGPSIQRVPIHDLASAELTPMATLYVPPKGEPSVDSEMFERLGLSIPAAQ